MPERRELKFHGRVQGVGFRHTACQVASQFEVSGWVKNLPDLTVRMVVEGDTSQVERFLRELERAVNGGFGEIRETELIELGPASNEYSTFSVR